MPLSLRLRDEEALQSRRRADQAATSEDARAEAPQCPKTEAHPISSFSSEGTRIVGLTRENARLLNEHRDHLQQQAATAEVLKVISRSSFDLQAVLNTLLQSAAHLSEADRGVILRPSGKDASYYVAASYRQTPQYNEYQKNLTFAPGRGSVVARVLVEHKSVQIPDVLADREYTLRELARLGDFRTVLGVPLLRDEVPIGLFILHRVVVRPFSDEQIALVENFAAPAVIAIENARLLNELRQRTDDLTERTSNLTEALEQQTATSEVLQVISSTPGDLQPVFATMLETRFASAMPRLEIYTAGTAKRCTCWHRTTRRQRSPRIVGVHRIVLIRILPSAVWWPKQNGGSYQ